MLKKIVGLTVSIPKDVFDALVAANPGMKQSDGSLAVLLLWGIVLIGVLPEPVV